MQGLDFVVLKRKGFCSNCKSELLSGTKTILLGSFNNKYRYCTTCFLKRIEQEFDVEILDFVKGDVL